MEQSPASPVSPAPLTTIEEQEDQRILERAHEQARREKTSHEEFDIGRTTSMSPNAKKPEQILPKVTLESSHGSSHGANQGVNHTDADTATSNLTEKPNQLIESPESEVGSHNENQNRLEDYGFTRTVEI